MHSNTQRKTDNKKVLNHDSPENESRLQKRICLLGSAVERVIHEDVETPKVADILEQKRVQPTCCHDGLQAIADTIRQTMLEISEARERNQERRHRELMELLANYLTRDVTERKGELSCTTNTNPTPAQTSLPRDIEIDDSDASVELLGYTQKGEDTAQRNTSTNELAVSSAQHSTSAMDIQKKTVPAFETDLIEQKRELEEMRVRMLEVQRQKMADRERKKQEGIQAQWTG